MKLQRRDLIAVAVVVLGATALTQLARQQRASAQDAWGPRIAAVARPGDIEMFSTADCIYCARAREWMNRHRIAFAECRIDADAACAARFQALGGPGTPVMLVRGQAQVGFNAARVGRQLGLDTPASP